MEEASLSRLRGIVCRLLEVDREALTLDASFMEHLGADSLDMVNLCMEIEEAFGVTIPEGDYQHLATVKGAIDYLDKRLLGAA